MAENEGRAGVTRAAVPDSQTQDLKGGTRR